MGRLADRIGNVLVTAAATRAIAAVAAPAADLLPGGQARWDRTNHRGETVTLLEGPVAALGIASLVLSGRSTKEAGAAAHDPDLPAPPDAHTADHPVTATTPGGEPLG